MASWKKILVEGDAVTNNLATDNLTQSGSVRSYDLNGNTNRIAFKDGIVQFSDSSNNVSHQIDNANGVFDARSASGIRLSDGDNAQYVDLKPKSEITASYTITLPNASPGAANKILESDASGNLSWIDTPSGGGGSIDGSGTATHVTYWLDSDTLTSSSDFIFDGTDVRVTNSVICSEIDANTVNVEVTGMSTDGDLGRGAELLNVSGSLPTTAGRMYYLNSSSSWTAADKDDEPAADGFLVVATGSNATAGMLIRGLIRIGAGAIGGTVAVGDKLYLSDSGLFTSDTSGFGTGDFVRAVGHYVATNVVYFNPSQEYIELA